MELQTPINAARNPNQDQETYFPDAQNHIHTTHEPQSNPGDVDSACSTPYVSAPSSPGRLPGSGAGGFYYSAPASPMQFATASLSSMPASTRPCSPDSSVPLGFEFEFSRFGSYGSGQIGSMSSADELFLNGQIRPMKLSTHLERHQLLAPLLDLERKDEDEGDKFERRDVEGVARGRDLRLRDKSMRRRVTRSMSPSRNATDFNLINLDDANGSLEMESSKKNDGKSGEVCRETSASMSASSSRSSSAGRGSKRWVFLKDFLIRSKSEGRSNNKFWSNLSFHPMKERKQESKDKKVGNDSAGVGSENQKTNKPVNGVGKRRIPPSPHERHYTANRAQAEEMRKRTYLPYQQGLLGCLGFSSKGYRAMSGFARALNPVSSR